MGKNKKCGRGDVAKTRIEAFPAYALNELTKVGLYGETREEVLWYIINDWLSGKWRTLSELEITVQKAREEGWMKGRRG